jgi:hypothetical protein
MKRSSFPELVQGVQGVNLDKTLDALIDAGMAETKPECPGRYDPNAGVVGDSVDLGVFEKAGQKTLEVGRETLEDATKTGRFSRGYEQLGGGLPTALALTVHRDLQGLKERVNVLEDKISYLMGVIEAQADRLASYENNGNPN